MMDSIEFTKAFQSTEVLYQKGEANVRTLNKVVTGFALLLSVTSCIVMFVLVVKVNNLEMTATKIMESSPSSRTPLMSDVPAKNINDFVTNINKTINRLMEYGDKASICSVGLKDGRIKDYDITASSFLDTRCQPKYARLDNTGTMFAFWRPKQCNNSGEWIQVYLRNAITITGVVTQGRSDDDEDWVSGFTISYGDIATNLTTITDENGASVIFEGNTNMHTYKINRFSHPIIARYVRLIVQTWHHCPALRLEFLTC